MRKLKPVTKLTDEQRRETREVCTAAREKIGRGEFFGNDLGERLAEATSPHRVLALLDERDAQATEIARLREAQRDAAGTAGRIAASERKAIDDMAGLRNEQDLDRAAVRRLVEALPTTGHRSLGITAQLRALQARMATWGEAVVAPVVACEPWQPFTALPPLTWVRDLEEFEGPILSELRDESGALYLEKWCTRTAAAERTLVVRSDRAAIEGYLAGRSSMLDLLTKPSGDVGFLVDRAGGEQIGVRMAQVSALPDSYLPMPTAMHEESLRPETHAEEPDDSPRCEVCSGPAGEDDPGRAFDPEDSIYVCGTCARKLDAGDHERDVAAIRAALEVEADVSAAIDWPAFWSRRARLGKAAEGIEAPVRATVEWMGQEKAPETLVTTPEDLWAVLVTPLPGDEAPPADPPTRPRAPGPPVPPEPDDEPSAYDAEVAERMAR